jgi:BASS family bile acid:Na+ symporter
LGYLCGRVLARGVNVARTISIEVGMQNSGLGAALAKANLGGELASVPSAISAVVHCVIGSAVAAVWSRQPPSGS